MDPQTIKGPDEALKRLFNACDPFRAALPDHYVDCTEARGGSGLVRDYMQKLGLAQTGAYRTYLLSGHIGCGKSSELGHLRQKLKEAGYAPILVVTDDYLNIYDVEVSDILLAIVTELADVLRDDYGIELRDGAADSLWQRIRATLGEIQMDAELELKAKAPIPKLPFLEAGAKVKIQRLKQNDSVRIKVRKALQERMDTLLDEVNSILLHAGQRLHQAGGKGARGVVVLLDNLEKIWKVGGYQEGLESQRELFLERYAQLTGLSAHVIYTVPLRLLRSPIDGPRLLHLYGGAFVLPMIKVQERQSRTPYATGMGCLQKMLEQRAGQPLPQVFAPAALDFLLTYSGGHTRQLMTFVQNACAYSEALPIQLPAAHRAIAQTVSMYSTTILEPHWRKLAELDLSDDQKLRNGDPDHLSLLESLALLEYVNGGEETNPFDPVEQWYAVHPIVRELGKFKKARRVLEQERAELRAQGVRV